MTHPLFCWNHVSQNKNRNFPTVFFGDWPILCSGAKDANLNDVVNLECSELTLINQRIQTNVFQEVPTPGYSGPIFNFHVWCWLRHTPLGDDMVIAMAMRKRTYVKIVSLHWWLTSSMKCLWVRSHCQSPHPEDLINISQLLSRESTRVLEKALNEWSHLVNGTFQYLRIVIIILSRHRLHRLDSCIFSTDQGSKKTKTTLAE